MIANKVFYSLMFASLFTLVLACEKEKDVIFEVEDNLETPDWTELSHSKNAELDYAVVFPQDKVLEFTIQIDPENWEILQQDLANNITSGFSGPPGGGPGGGGPGGGGIPGEVDFDPVWIPCSFFFEGIEWYKVGIRVKGNSSLRSTYMSGIDKFSFKLDFDEFEDDYEQIKNQRFYGFKQLNLNNNFEDASLMREKVASDLFRAFGLVSAQTSFAAVYIDHGEGLQYFGLYTLVEEMDNTVIETQLGNDSGNLYKPENQAATFANGSYEADDMNKKNNEDEADFSDVIALYNTLNNESRTTDSDNWMSQLETVLDVDVFLKWLAANTCMQNWDTYGVMTHNYYLYNHHDSNKLVWIPWDNNEALQEGKMGGALSVSLDEVGSGWPLIRYLMDQPSYQQQYEEQLFQFISTVFTSAQLAASYDYWQSLISYYVSLEESGYTFLRSSADFDSEISYLKQHAGSRVVAVEAYLK